jgi:hypothetical protein
MLLAPLLVAVALGGSPAASLTIGVRPGPAYPTKTWTLRCGPTGGTLPRAASACKRLSAFAGDPFAPTPPGTACSEIYGGPQEARVRGMFRGRRVSTIFRRRDGCEIARWARVAFLFPVRL